MRALSRFLVVIALGLLAAGCGGGQQVGSVSGTVTYKEKPVTGGLMFFIDANGKGFPASLNADGNYNATGIPPGDYIVTIDTSAMKQWNPAESMKEMAPKQGQFGQGKVPEAMKDIAKQKEMQGNTGAYVAIPEKYKDKKTSGLTVKVETGSQTKNFPLTD